MQPLESQKANLLVVRKAIYHACTMLILLNHIRRHLVQAHVHCRAHNEAYTIGHMFYLFKSAAD